MGSRPVITPTAQMKGSLIRNLPYNSVKAPLVLFCCCGGDLVKKQITILASCALVGIANAQFFDDFNRADSTNMGPNWIEQSGDFFVGANRANTGGVQATAWMSVVGVSVAPTAATVSADVFELSS